jgi:Uncharacterized protein conserved in bacteria
MIHLTKALARRWLGTLLHVDDTPERTAAAFALGVFFGFSPFLGLHTILGIVFAFLLNYNRVAVLLGVYSNLPWVIAPYYALTTMFVGAPLTGHRIPEVFDSKSSICSSCLSIRATSGMSWLISSGRSSSRSRWVRFWEPSSSRPSPTLSHWPF